VTPAQATDQDEAAPAQNPQRLLRTPLGGLSTHILPTSATMVGVCMTVLSIGHLGRGGEARVVIDKLLAGDAVVFLASALLSFMSIRGGHANGRLESHAEVVFIAGLGVLAVVAVALAFAIR
jgi:amino acid transporter